MTTSVARVSLNGVEVGSVPAESYYALIAEVRRDTRLYVSQVLNLLWCVLRLSGRAVLALPATWFMLFAAAVVLYPTEAAGLVAVIREASPEDVVYAAARFLKWSFGVATMGLVIRSLFSSGAGFGYVNQFDRVISDRLRQRLEVPAVGDIYVNVGAAVPV